MTDEQIELRAMIRASHSIPRHIIRTVHNDYRTARLCGRELWRAWNLHDGDYRMYDQLVWKFGINLCLGLAGLLKDRATVTGKTRSAIRKYIWREAGRILWDPIGLCPVYNS